MLTPKNSVQEHQKKLFGYLLIRKSKPVKMRYKYYDVIPTLYANRNKNNIRKGLTSLQEPDPLSLEIRLVPLRNQRPDYLP